MKALQKMEQGDSVPLTEFTLLLLETGDNFTITSHAFRFVDPVSFLGGFQQVPKLISQESAVPVLGQACIQDLPFGRPHVD
jgi:hypothetical protein